MIKSVEPRHAKVIERWFFGGLTVEQTADVVHMSTNSTERDWRPVTQSLVRELEGTLP